MRFHSRWVATVLSVLALGALSATHAALIDRGGGLIYDTDLDVTWLSDTTIGGYGISWDGALIWAANFSYYDSVRDVTYTDWRLPKADTACSSYNCTGSELGHLFYNELGGVAGQTITTTHNDNYNLFQNISEWSYFWTGNEYAGFCDAEWGYCFEAWDFYFYIGAQGHNLKTYTDYYRWAVRDGDVAGMSVVPVPAAFWLFGSGLLGLIGVAYRRAA